MPFLLALPFVYVLQFMPAKPHAEWQTMLDARNRPQAYSDIYTCAKRAMFLEHVQGWLFWGCRQVEVEK